jgi:subtilisin-like proprotein convertase family protein
MNNVTLPFKQTRTGTININQSMEVHSVSVSVAFNHSNWGDLHVELESPSGSRSVLAEPHRNQNQNSLSSYTYLSTQQLKENSAGNWKLHVTDDGTDGEGVWASWSISVMGHTVQSGDNHSPTGEDLILERTSFPVEIDTFEGLTDPDGDTLEILSVQYPASGELEHLGEGLFSYTMGETKNGWDSFSVLYGDGNGGVKRRIIRVLDPRPVGRVDLLPLVAGETYELPVLSNDLDPDGDPLRLVSAQPESGGIGFLGELEVLPNQNVRYSSELGDSGVARFQYNLTDDSDGESSGWATIVLSPTSDIAVTLDGEDDHLLVPPTTGINMRDRFTCEAWIYPESYGEYVTGFGRIFDRDTFIFYLNGFDHTSYNDKSLVAYFIMDDGQTFTAANSIGNVIQLNKWQHVAISYDSSNFSSPVRMYVDGIPVFVSYPLAGTTAPRSPIYNNTGFNLYIGENEDGARAFKGSIAELRVWNSRLSDSNILNRHDQRLSGNEFGLQLYLPFDQTLEPEAISVGSFKGKATLFEALRVPRILPWRDLEADLEIVANANNGWWEERNLGWLYGDAYPWIYLPYLGWSIVERNPSSNVYYLLPATNNWGWLYTSPQLFPWLYRVDDGTWILYEEAYEGGPWLYFYGSSSWLRPQDDVPDS